MSNSTPLEELQAAIASGTLTPALLQQALPLLDSDKLAELMTWLKEHRRSTSDPSWPEAEQQLLAQIVALTETRLLQRPVTSEDSLREAIAQYYAVLPADSPSRGGLLRLLAALAAPAELGKLAELLAQDPPASAESAALALSPLFRRNMFDPAALFPSLLDSVLHQQVAPAALDAMNYLTREKLLKEHPARERSGQLGLLLGEVAGRLISIEERREVPDAQTQQQVREAISLTVALCDALALIGDQEQVGKVRQALGITHRRIHTEAAYALARLGEEEGEALLLQLATEPFARLRVLAYAEELGIEQQIEEEYRTPQARAEAELVAWIAEPMQMGMPPHSLELIDQREMYWPSYEEPVNCYLFRFIYEFPGGQLSNIGIAGPLTMAFSADLNPLPLETIYAAFAGWHAEHADIYETPYESLTGASQRLAERNCERLVAQEFSDIEPISLGNFFEQSVLIAQARREGKAGIATVDDQEIDWWTTDGNPRPLGAREVYCIYKGKRLLETFNA